MNQPGASVPQWPVLGADVGIEPPLNRYHPADNPLSHPVPVPYDTARVTSLRREYELHCDGKLLVVTVHITGLDPPVIVAVYAVDSAFALVSRTASVCPARMTPLVTHPPPLIEICGLPWPEIDNIAVPAPVVVTLDDVVSVFAATPVMSAKANDTEFVEPPQAMNQFTPSEITLMDCHWVVSETEALPSSV